MPNTTRSRIKTSFWVLQVLLFAVVLFMSVPPARALNDDLSVDAKVVYSDRNGRAGEIRQQLAESHATALTINQIASVNQGFNIIVSGTLLDSDDDALSSSLIGGQIITFDGTGADYLPDSITNSDGTFVSTGRSKDSVGSWKVQAHFAGDDLLAAADSNTESYDTIEDVAAAPTAIPLHSNEGDSTNPQVAVADNRVYVVWQDSAAGNGDIFLKRSTDYGENFEDVINVSDNSGESLEPRAAVSGNHVYVVWFDSSPGNSDVFLAVGTESENGFIIGDPINISENSGSSIRPQIAAAGPNVYLVWLDTTDLDPGNTDIFFKRIGDSGGNLEDEIINLSDNPEISQSPRIAAAADGAKLYVVWQNSISGVDDILFSRSTNYGASFDSEEEQFHTNLSDNDGPSVNPQIAISADGEKVYVVWHDSTLEESGIILRRSLDAGLDFQNIETISHNPLDQVNPQIVSSADAKNIHIVWQTSSFSDNSDVFLASSTNSGTSFSDGVNLSNNPGHSIDPRIIAPSSTNKVNVVWSDNNAGNSDIFLATSDGEDGFSCPVSISHNPGSSNKADLAVIGNNLYIVWEDSTPGLPDIFLARNPDYVSPSISIDHITNISPKWGYSTTITGSVAGIGSDDSVTIDWDDDKISKTKVEFVHCQWSAEQTYGSSSIGLHHVVASVVEGSTEKASSSTDIEVTKHGSLLTLDSMASVKQGSSLTLTGSLVDLDADSNGISGMSISFSGTGVGDDFPSAETNAAGIYSATGVAPDIVADALDIQAFFDGDSDSLYEVAVSDVIRYDTADIASQEFAVEPGEDIAIDLNELVNGSSIMLEKIISAGPIFVAQCSSPDSSMQDRFVPLDLCLRVISGAQIEPGSSVKVNIPFEEKMIPEGFNASDIHMFRTAFDLDQGSDVIADITQQSNLTGGEITGETSNGLGKFLLGAALFNERDANAVSQKIFVGDNEVNFRNVENRQNITADDVTISLNKALGGYRVGETATLTITDSEANLDPAAQNTIEAYIRTDSDSQIGIGVTLLETGSNTTVFQGTFGVTSDPSDDENNLVQTKPGDTVKVFYRASHARANIQMENMENAGIIHVSDHVILTPGTDPVALGFTPIGGAINIQFEHAKISSDGRITITISYANADLEDQDPEFLVLVHFNEDTQNWDVISPIDDEGFFVGADEEAKTVTGIIDEQLSDVKVPVGGIYSIATCIGQELCGGGGSGGGLGLPGSGVVVDFVASIAKKSGGGGGGGTTTSAIPALGASEQPSTSEPIPSGENVGTEIILTEGGSGGGPHTGGGGKGTIKMLFENITFPGEITVAPLPISQETPGISIVSADNSQATINENSADSNFTTASTIYNITMSPEMEFVGFVDITIPYNESQAASESSVRLLHYNGTVWEDATIDLDNGNNTVTGRVHSLSPVVAAVVEDGTFASGYFQLHPLDKLQSSDLQIVLFDSEIKQQLNGVASLDQNITISESVRNLQRVPQDLAYVVEVFDGRGVVVALSVHSDSLERGELKALKSTWTPAERGTYTIKVFVIDDLESDAPMLLKGASSGTVEVK